MKNQVLKVEMQTTLVQMQLIEYKDEDKRCVVRWRDLLTLKEQFKKELCTLDQLSISFICTNSDLDFEKYLFF